MSRLAFANPESTSMDILFPDEYRRSCQTIAKDFVFLGATTTLAIIGLVSLLNVL